MANKWRRMPTPAATVLENPVVMYQIVKENNYNKRLKEAVNKTNPNTFTIIWTEPQNRLRVYVWTPTEDWNWIYISDVKTQKQWYFPKTYRSVIDWHQTYYDNIDTSRKIHEWYNNKRWGLADRVRTRFFDKIYNSEWLTLWELTARDILNNNSKK